MRHGDTVNHTSIRHGNPQGEKSIYCVAHPQSVKVLPDNLSHASAIPVRCSVDDHCALVIALAASKLVMLESQSNETGPRLPYCDDVAHGAGEARSVLARVLFDV